MGRVWGPGNREWMGGSRMLLAEGVLQYLAKHILQSSQAASILERVSDGA